MTKFLITAGLIFGTMLVVILGIYGFLTISAVTGELLYKIERKYGFKGSVISFLVLMAIASVIGATILVLTGV